MYTCELSPKVQRSIYELHVRGYTCHPSSNVAHAGTFLGLCEKIPHLKKLGVTAVQLMPVVEFNELDNLHKHPNADEPLKNYWGYSPIAFFAPKASYAAGDQVREFKQMVKAFHQAGIEVILDVVYNHTCEGNENGPTISFRGFDNSIYYMLDKQGRYYNYSGCGNTLNCNHPVVRDLIDHRVRSKEHNLRHVPRQGTTVAHHRLFHCNASLQDATGVGRQRFLHRYGGRADFGQKSHQGRK